MRSVRVVCAFALVAAALAHAQSPLGGADEAYRRGDLRQAARLYAQAADAESDAARRADIRVKLAWTYFGAKNRGKTEEAIAAALRDNPALELDPVYYTDEFVALFARVKARPPAAAAVSPGVPRPTPTPPSTAAGVRQRLAQAPDSAAIEPILAEIQQLEAVTPPLALPELLDLKAEALERLGRTAEALEQRGRVGALRAVAQSPPGTNPAPLDTLLEARRLIAVSRAADAAALLRGVLAALPSCAPALELLGESYLEAGRLDDAVNVLRTALLGNEKADTLLVLGEAEFRRGRLPAAREAFRRAAEVDASNDRALAALGLLAARSGDLPAARDLLDKALASNGALFEARVVRAQVALAEGNAGDAQQHLQRALQLKPDDPWASAWLGWAELSAGNPAAAAEHLATAGKAGAPLFVVAQAEALRRSGKPDEALAILTAQADPPPAGTVVRAHCLLDAGRAAEAVAALQEAVAKRPDDVRLRIVLAAALNGQRDWAGVVRELERAATLRGAPAHVREDAVRAQATREAQRLLDEADTVTPTAKP